MRKSILFSVMVIGAALAIVAGASSFATFTDSSTATTTSLTAGTVKMDINGTHGTVGVTLAGTNCPQTGNMAFNDSCTVSYNVNNTGTLSVVFSYIDSFTSTPTGCYSTSVTEPVNDGSADPDVNPGSGVIASVTVTLNNLGAGHPALDNACQSATFTGSVAITATQSATPHD